MIRLLILFSFFLAACDAPFKISQAPPVKTIPRRAKTGLAPTPYAAILTAEQVASFTRSSYLLDLAVVDRGRSRDCEYPEVLERARNKAMAVGGNVLVVTKHRLPDQTGSSCSRIRAQVFRAPSLEGLESEIRWDTSRPLLPGDLRGKRGSVGLPPVHCTLKYRLLGDFFNDFTVRTQTLFSSDSTWRPETGNLFLRRAQLHFDLAELAARGFKAELTALAPNLRAMTGQAKEIMKKHQSAWQLRAAGFDAEWEAAGRSEAVLTAWEQGIARELADSAARFGDVTVSLRRRDYKKE